MHCSFPRVPVSASFSVVVSKGRPLPPKLRGDDEIHFDCSGLKWIWDNSNTEKETIRQMSLTYSEFGVFSCVFQHTNAPNLYQFSSSRRQEEEICSLKSQLLPQDNKWPVPDTGSRVRTRANDQYQKPHQPLSGASVLITDPVGPGRLPLLKQQTQLLIYCIELAQISRHSPLHRRH